MDKRGDYYLSKPKIRWILLVFILFLSYSEIYLIDLPMGMSYYLQNVDFHLNSFKYNMLYTIFTSPNIFLSLFVGSMNQKYGATTMLIICWVFILIGQVLMFLGGIYNNYWFLFSGRIFSGIGCENALVSRLLLIGNWFWHYEISFAYSCILIIGRYGTNTVGLLTPYYYNINNSLFWPLLIPLIMAIICIVCCTLIYFIDKKYIIRKTKENSLLIKEVNEINVASQIKSISDKVDSQILLPKTKANYFYCSCKKLAKLKKLGWLFIPFFLTFSFYYGTLYAWIGNTNELLCTHYSLTSKKAGLYMFCAFSLTIFGPFFGIFVDKYGKRLYLLFTGMLIYLVVITLTIYWPFDKNLIFVNFLFVGLGFSMYSCTFFPCFKAYINPEVNFIGNGLLAFGLNFFVFFNTLVFGNIRDNTKYKDNGFFYSYWFLIIQTIIISCCCIFIIIYDKKYNLKLNSVNLK